MLPTSDGLNGDCCTRKMEVMAVRRLKYTLKCLLWHHRWLIPNCEESNFRRFLAWKQSMFPWYNPSAGPAGALRRSPDNVHTTSLLTTYFCSYWHFYIFPIQDSHNYFGQITANMSEDIVKDIVHEAIGSNWDFLTKLEMWTHYDNALLLLWNGTSFLYNQNLKKE